MSNIIPFEFDHFDRLELSEIDRRRVDADPYARNKIAALAKTGIGGTILDGDFVIAIFGFFETYPGVFDIYAFPSVKIKEYATVYLKAAKRYVQFIESHMNPRRIQTASLSDEVHDRWMRFLGLECETPNGMKQYSALPGETYKMWAKTYGV